MSFKKILSLTGCSKLLYRLGPQQILYPSLPSVYHHHYSSPNFTEFSKKTGDYFSLSAVDIQVLGLTYQLEKQYVGTEHLRSVPVVQKVDKLSEHLSAAELGVTGFYMPPKKDVACSPNIKPDDNPVSRNAPEVEIEGEETVPEIGEKEEVNRESVVVEERLRELEKEKSQAMHDLEEALRRAEVTDLDAESAEGDIARNIAKEDAEEEEEGENYDDIWDDNAWITPDNVEEAKRDLKAAQVEESPVKVACITGDFAMQFSIPKPKGGKHAVNPILCPDQRMPQQLTSALARSKNNPLEPDYIAGYSPFLMRDVTSRSAVLGIRSTQTQVKNWMRRNPNEVVKKGKRRR